MLRTKEGLAKTTKGIFNLFFGLGEVNVLLIEKSRTLMKTNLVTHLQAGQLNDAIEYLNKKDTVNFAEKYTSLTDSTTTVKIKSGGSLSRIRGLLLSKKEREEKADTACRRIDEVLKGRCNEKALESVKKNIRAQITKTGCLTGEFLARNLVALQQGESLVRKDENKP